MLDPDFYAVTAEELVDVSQRVDHSYMSCISPDSAYFMMEVADAHGLLGEFLGGKDVDRDVMSYSIAHALDLAGLSNSTDES